MPSISPLRRFSPPLLLTPIIFATPIDAAMIYAYFAHAATRRLSLTPLRNSGAGEARRRHAPFFFCRPAYAIAAPLSAAISLLSITPGHFRRCH